VNPSTGNLVISAQSNTLYFNLDHGASEVLFAAGQLHIGAFISGTGNATFYGLGNSSFAGSLGIGTTAPS